MGSFFLFHYRLLKPLFSLSLSGRASQMSSFGCYMSSKIVNYLLYQLFHIIIVYIITFQSCAAVYFVCTLAWIYVLHYVILPWGIIIGINFKSVDPHFSLNIACVLCYVRIAYFISNLVKSELVKLLRCNECFYNQTLLVYD